MKNVISIMFYIVMVLCFTNDLKSQCNTYLLDPQLTSANFTIGCVNQASTSLLRVNWSMGGGAPGTAPSGSWQIEIQFPVSGEYGIVNTSAIMNGSVFNWVYDDGTKKLTGTSNASVSWLNSGLTTVNVTGFQLNNCTAVQVSAKIIIVPNANGGCTSAFNGNQTSNDMLTATMGVQQALPVELTEFYGLNKECKGVELYWVTASENNNNYFEVLRSADGKDFKSVGRIKGQNLSFGAEYSWFDEDVFSHGTSYYYRLKQIDFDGRTTGFEVISVLYECSDVSEKLTLYPNPARSSLFVQYSSEYPLNNAFLLDVIDCTGRMIFSGIHLSVNDLYEMDIRDLSPGIYTLRVSGLETSGAKRFIKLDD